MLLLQVVPKRCLGAAKIMRRIPTCSAFLLSVGFLFACSSNGVENFDRRMANYIGLSEMQLIEDLGVPNRAYEAEGRRFLQYDFSTTAASTSSSFSLGFGVGSFSGSRYGRGSSFGTGLGVGVPISGSGYGLASCLTNFEIREGRVLDFRRQGESCR
jgi:hypothetical protein